MMRNFIRTFVVMSLSLVSSMSLSAIEVNEFSVQRLTNSEGLCSQQIYSVKQTPDGAIWWASKSCVERYNGVSVKCYCPNAPAEVGYLAGHHWNLFLSADGTIYAFDNKGEVLEYDGVKDAFNLKVNLRDIFGTELILNDICLVGDDMYIAAGHGAFLLRGGSLEPIYEGSYANAVVPAGQNVYFCMTDGVRGLQSSTFSFLAITVEMLLQTSLRVMQIQVQNFLIHILVIRQPLLPMIIK